LCHSIQELFYCSTLRTLVHDNKKASKVLDFLTACKLFIRMRMRDIAVKKQIQWVLSYVQGGLVDI